MSGFFPLEITGTIAFAVSGALVGIKHKMDLFGVTMLGLVTAVGGGVMRDIVIGNTPPAVFKDPFAALAAVGVSVAVFSFYYFLYRYTERYAVSSQAAPEKTPLKAAASGSDAACAASSEYRHASGRFNLLKNEIVRRYSEALLFLADTVGLAVFTVIGIKSAVDVYPDNYAVLIFVGVITGTGGGVLRDLLSVSIPYIFKKHIYAIASIFGALTCAFLIYVTGEKIALVTGAVIVIVIRVCAALFKWNLPVIKN